MTAKVIPSCAPSRLAPKIRNQKWFKVVPEPHAAIKWLNEVVAPTTKTGKSVHDRGRVRGRGRERARAGAGDWGHPTLNLMPALNRKPNEDLCGESENVRLGSLWDLGLACRGIRVHDMSRPPLWSSRVRCAPNNSQQPLRCSFQRDEHKHI